MAQFSVNDQTRRVRAVVSGTNQQEFSVAFQSNSTTDIKVFVGTTQKTEGTHYDIKATTGDSAANGLADNGTCVVKFRHDASAGIDHRPTQNQVVTIISDIALARSSVYTAGGNITAESLESDFDTVTMQMAEREEAASRALTAPKFDPTDIDMTLPDQDSRKGKGLAFNASTGNPEAATFIQSASEVRAMVESASDSNVFTDADHSKLNGIEASATADQTASEIRSLVGSASDSNVFTDADHTKLDGIEAGATADQTANEIKTAYESNADTNAFTDAFQNKLNGIEASATADQTAPEIKTAYESNADTNAFTNALLSKLNGIENAADVTDTTNVVAALTAGSNISIDPDGTIDAAAASGLSSLVVDGSPQLGGTLDTNNQLIQFGDSSGATVNRLQFGDSQDLSLYHDNNSSINHNGTGDLYLNSNNNTIFYNSGVAKINIQDGSSGGVKLYYGNATLTAETTSEGLDVQTGIINVKNSGSPSEVRLFCESSNAHYAALKAPVHNDLVGTGNTTLTLPAATGTIVSTGDNGSVLTGMIADNAVTGDKLNDIANVSGSYTNADITVDAQGRITAADNGSGGGGGGSASDSFKTIAVTGTTGQSDVVATSSTDTLTFAAGSNMTITTNASNDTITFASSGGGGGGGGGGASALNGLSDVTISSVQNNDLLMYNATAAQWQNTNLGVTVEPTITMGSSFYVGNLTATLAPSSGTYSAVAYFAEVVNSVGTVVVSNANITKAGNTLSWTMSSTGTNFVLRVKAQDFGDLQSEIATKTFTVNAFPTARYYRLTGSGGTNSTFVRELELFTSVSQGGTEYPLANMTGTTAPSPLVASSSGYSYSNYPEWKAFDGTSTSGGWWNLGSTPYNSWYLQIDIVATNVAIQSARISLNANYQGGNNNTYTLAGSTSGSFSGEETVIGTFTGQAPSQVGSTGIININ